ncbi:DMT family transporter [Salinirubrum litoreum]|uniref:DMT family transporter n=1 Tax=Salinirubrum litoreum TaxID=1126234 RepID=A0ABD5R8F8_9EURY
MSRRLPAIAPVAPLGAAVLWGGMYVVSRWGFEAIPPVTLAFLRVLLGGVVLLLVVRLREPTRSFSRAEWSRFALLGVWVAVTLATQFLGTALTTASQGSLLTVLTPVFTLALGVALLDESLSRAKVVGTGLALAGTLVVVAATTDLGTLDGGAGGGSLGGTVGGLGVLALLLASLGWALYTVQGAPLVRRYGALTTATYSTLFAVPLLAVGAGVEVVTTGADLGAISWTPALLAAVGYLGVASTALAWYLWYKGLEYVDSGTVAVFFFAQPVVGTVLGVLLLDEQAGPAFLLGGAVMAVGIYVVSSARGE